MESGGPAPGLFEQHRRENDTRLKQETNRPINECQPGPDDCWVSKLTTGDYYFRLAAYLKTLEDKQDEEGLDQIWSTYGSRDCLLAAHIAETHPALLPELTENDPRNLFQEPLPGTSSRTPGRARDGRGTAGLAEDATGGQEAIRVGLVRESGPTWVYRDDHRATNGFSLTGLGRSIMIEHGYVCTCAGCADRAVQVRRAVGLRLHVRGLRPHAPRSRRDRQPPMPELQRGHPAVRDRGDHRGNELQVPRAPAARDGPVSRDDCKTPTSEAESND